VLYSCAVRQFEGPLWVCQHQCHNQNKGPRGGGGGAFFSTKANKGGRVSAAGFSEVNCSTVARCGCAVGVSECSSKCKCGCGTPLPPGAAVALRRTDPRPPPPCPWGGVTPLHGGVLIFVGGGGGLKPKKIMGTPKSQKRCAPQRRIFRPKADIFIRVVLSG
jgi:hypothetical protein